MEKVKARKFKNLLPKITKNNKTRKCPKCKQILPATHRFFNINKTHKSGLDGWCKDCKKKYDELRHKIYKYGLTMDNFNKMLEKQKNRCAICGSFFKDRFPFLPFVDHNHNNNVLRELLCHSCNLLLGHASENTFVLVNAIFYLKRHKKEGLSNKL